MKFEEAMALMRGGERVRRSSWSALDTNVYISPLGGTFRLALGMDSGSPHDLPASDILAADWEVYVHSVIDEPDARVLTEMCIELAQSMMNEWDIRSEWLVLDIVVKRESDEVFTVGGKQVTGFKQAAVALVLAAHEERAGR